ncbi:hypothetical protein [Sulfurisphaera javensis]
MKMQRINFNYMTYHSGVAFTMKSTIAWVVRDINGFPILYAN